MSGFDDNPFGDPKVNPFQDPSVRQAAAPGETLPKLDDYNPFADGATKPVSTGVTAQTAPRQAVDSEQPPAYSASAAAPNINTEDLQKRQEELERKAAELARKEQELRGVEAAHARENNWPPLPGKCIPKCFYQDINVDIPQEFQKLVRILYYIWLTYSLTLLFNIGGGLAYFIVDDGSNDGGQLFGLAIMYFVLFIPCSFVCWFRTVYKAFRSDSSFNFFVFFFVFFFQFVANIIMAVGIPGGGFCGVINALSLVGKKSAGQVAVGCFMLAIGVVFGLLAAASFVLLVKVHRIYRSTGASFQKAQQEFASGVMRSDTVQTATQQAASSAVHGAFQSGTRQ